MFADLFCIMGSDLMRIICAFEISLNTANMWWTNGIRAEVCHGERLRKLIRNAEK